MHDDTVGAAAPDEVWEDEDYKGPGHPLVATIICAILMFASVGAPQIAEAGQGAAYAVGRALGGTLILWTIAYFITIKRASIGWKVGSFMILLLIGTLTTLYSMGQNNIAVRDDLRTLTQLQFKEDDVTLPPGSASRGPVSAMFVEYFNGMAADGRAMEARLSALGIERLANADALRRDPAILSDCGKIATGKAAVADSFASGKARIAGLGPKIDALAVPDQLRKGLREGLLKNNGAQLLDQQRALIDSMIDEQVGICKVLARRHWTPSNGNFMFTSNADLAAFQAHANRVTALHAEAQRLQRAQMEQGRQSQRTLEQILR